MAAQDDLGRVSKAGGSSLSPEEMRAHKEVLEDLAGLERQFASVELDQQRTKEHALRPLYEKRRKTLARIQDFWSTVFLSPPPQVAQYIQPSDIELLTHITSFHVNRFEIDESGTNGDPRSIRITFEFAANEIIEDRKLVKELRYRHARKGSAEGLVSDPVPIKWKSKKKDLTRGLGPCAVSLFEAEKAVRLQVGGQEFDAVSRESLWQNERVLQGLRTMGELGQERLGFFAWFYYRGVDLSATRGKGDHGETDSVDEESDDGLRDVEIYPDGSDLANSLAEHLWEDAVDIYVKALKPPGSGPDDETSEMFDEELSRMCRQCPANSDEAKLSAEALKDHEVVHTVDTTIGLDDGWPNKKQRQS